MGDRDDYKFLALRDAISSINQKVNLIGVVIEFGQPRESKGTVNFFAGDKEKLPHIASTGDIIQLSRVMMKAHNGEVNAVFNKIYSSFAIYGGKDSQDFIPYQFSYKYHSRGQDKKFIEGLRKWLEDFKFDEGSNHYSMLREMKEGQHVDLVCKVIHICEVVNDERIAFVWDGTDAPPTSLQTKVEDGMGNEIPPQSNPLPLSRGILCTFPTVGTVLRVIADQGAETQIFHLLTAGKWTKILSLKCEVNSGLWHGAITCFTKLRHVSDQESLILERQRSFDKRLSVELERMPYWSFPMPSRITEVEYEGAPYATLMDVITYSKVTAKFKCIVRVIAAFPWQAGDFRSPIGTYRIRLTLEDPTARIHAFVYAEDGEEFFEGHPSVDVLTKKRNKLLGVAVNEHGQEIENAPRTPQWIQCCLKSYCLFKSDIWGSRHYRIFGTKLVG
ncbi:protection of telomeres protein 1b-like isoform X2 [Tripterygium wilfordii]|uniref:protection of telomeres protein 1b-like isoform X2 n=1 Tax=Tripterygium wilfordii TaxID=458696 RepID=UPI0018F82B3E|nr:protection of telomeres protein 1b-like isoform X2 [Tripterygium wilfordii]